MSATVFPFLLLLLVIAHNAKAAQGQPPLQLFLSIESAQNQCPCGQKHNLPEPRPQFGPDFEQQMIGNRIDPLQSSGSGWQQSARVGTGWQQLGQQLGSIPGFRTGFEQQMMGNKFGPGANLQASRLSIGPGWQQSGQFGPDTGFRTDFGQQMMGNRATNPQSPDIWQQSGQFGAGWQTPINPNPQQPVVPAPQPDMSGWQQSRSEQVWKQPFGQNSMSSGGQQSAQFEPSWQYSINNPSSPQPVGPVSQPDISGWQQSSGQVGNAWQQPRGQYAQQLFGSGWQKLDQITPQSFLEAGTGLKKLAPLISLATAGQQSMNGKPPIQSKYQWLIPGYNAAYYQQYHTVIPGYNRKYRTPVPGYNRQYRTMTPGNSVAYYQQYRGILPGYSTAAYYQNYGKFIPGYNSVQYQQYRMIPGYNTAQYQQYRTLIPGNTAYYRQYRTMIPGNAAYYRNYRTPMPGYGMAYWWLIPRYRLVYYRLHPWLIPRYYRLHPWLLPRYYPKLRQNVAPFQKAA